MTQNVDVANAFVQQARSHLKDDFMPKIRRCLEQLSEEDIWWRAHESDNSIGNLLLHLAGNVRQWLISGVGGAPDRRVRAQEFSERSHIGKADLVEQLESTLREADEILAGLSGDRLLEERSIQVYKKTVLQAVLHVVEHFAYHTGQIVYVTKMRRGVDLKFYNL